MRYRQSCTLTMGPTNLICCPDRSQTFWVGTNMGSHHDPYNATGHSHNLMTKIITFITVFLYNWKLFFDINLVRHISLTVNCLLVPYPTLSKVGDNYFCYNPLTGGTVKNLNLI